MNFNPISQIIYKTPKEFEKLSSKAIEVGTFPHYTFFNKVTSTYPKRSQYAKTCDILVVNDTMVHLAPELRGRNLVQDLSNFIRREKAEKDKVNAFVIGGRVDDKDSYTLFCDIGNTLEKEGADFSMICGKNENSKNGLDSLYHDGDKFVFTQEYNPTLEKEIKANKNPDSNFLQQIFEKFYDIIEISPKHKIAAE